MRINNLILLIFSIIFIINLSNGYRDISDSDYTEYLAAAITYKASSSIDNLANLEQTLNSQFNPVDNAASKTITYMGIISPLLSMVPMIGNLFSNPNTQKIFELFTNTVAGSSFVSTGILSAVDNGLLSPNYMPLVNSIESLIQGDIEQAIKQHDLVILSRELGGLKDLVADYHLRIQKGSSTIDIQLGAQSAYASFEENFYLFQLGTYTIPHFTQYVQAFIMLLEDLVHNGKTYGFSDQTIEIFREKRFTVAREAIKYIEETRTAAFNSMKPQLTGDEHFHAKNELRNFFSNFAYDFSNNWFTINKSVFPNGVITENARVTLSAIMGYKTSQTIQAIESRLDQIDAYKFKGIIENTFSLHTEDNQNGPNYNRIFRCARRDFKSGRLYETFSEKEGLYHTYNIHFGDFANKKIKYVKSTKGANEIIVKVGDANKLFTNVIGWKDSSFVEINFIKQRLADIMLVPNLNSFVFSFIDEDITMDNQVFLGTATQLDAQKYLYMDPQYETSYQKDAISYSRGAITVSNYPSGVLYKVNFNPPKSISTNKKEAARFDLLVVAKSASTSTFAIQSSVYIHSDDSHCYTTVEMIPIDKENHLYKINTIILQPGFNYIKLSPIPEQGSSFYLNSLIFKSI